MTKFSTNRCRRLRATRLLSTQPTGAKYNGLSNSCQTNNTHTRNSTVRGKFDKYYGLSNSCQTNNTHTQIWQITVYLVAVRQIIHIHTIPQQGGNWPSATASNSCQTNNIHTDTIPQQGGKCYKTHFQNNQICPRHLYASFSSLATYWVEDRIQIVFALL